MALIQQAQEYLRSLEFRPFPEFAKFDEFKLPQQSELSDRVTTNLQYYAANYLGIGVLFIAFLCISYPPFLFAVAVVVGGGGYLYSMRKGQPIVIKDRTLTETEIQYAYLAVSGLLTVALGGYIGLYVVLVWLLVVVLHAGFRQRTLKSRGTTAFTDLKSSIKEDIKASFSSKKS